MNSFFGILTRVGTFGQLSHMLFKGEGSQRRAEGSSEESPEPTLANKSLGGFYEEQPIVKEVPVCNSLLVSVCKCPETDKNLVSLETDLLGDVVVHWGICKNDIKKWEVPAEPHPPNTEVFKNKALRTRLQV